MPTKDSPIPNTTINVVLDGLLVLNFKDKYEDEDRYKHCEIEVVKGVPRHELKIWVTNETKKVMNSFTVPSNNINLKVVKRNSEVHLFNSSVNSPNVRKSFAQVVDLNELHFHNDKLSSDRSLRSDIIINNGHFYAYETVNAEFEHLKSGKIKNKVVAKEIGVAIELKDREQAILSMGELSYTMSHECEYEIYISNECDNLEHPDCHENDFVFYYLNVFNQSIADRWEARPLQLGQVGVYPCWPVKGGG